MTRRAIDRSYLCLSTRLRRACPGGTTTRRLELVASHHLPSFRLRRACPGGTTTGRLERQTRRTTGASPAEAACLNHLVASQPIVAPPGRARRRRVVDEPFGLQLRRRSPNPKHRHLLLQTLAV